MSQTKDRILEGIKRDGIVCPNPIIWRKFYELIVGEKDKSKWPPLPLVLTGWYATNKEAKHKRFCEHIQWADHNGAIELALEFINKTELDDWHYFDPYKAGFILKRGNDKRSFVSHLKKVFPLMDKKTNDSNKDSIQDTLLLWMDLVDSKINLEHAEIMDGIGELEALLRPRYDNHLLSLSIEEIYSILEFFSLNKPNQILPVDLRNSSQENEGQHKDSNVLYEKIHPVISEFMDEYIILGKKIAKNQKMLISSVQKEGIISDFHEDCMNWAQKRD